MGKYGGTYILLFVFISFFSFVSFVFAEEVSFQEMLQTVRRAGEEIRALQFQAQRVLGPRLPSDETPIFSTLRFGMRGEEVRALQELFRRDREIYPEGLVTGYFGVLTDNAVKRFQAAQGLEVTGIVDSWTRAYLRGFSRVVPPFLASEQEAASVPEVQDAALSLEQEVVSISTSTTSTSTLSVSTSTPATSTSTTSTVFSGGSSSGGGSPTVQSSGYSGGSSGGSGGSSPTPSTSSDGETVVIATSTIATSTPIVQEQLISTSTPSLAVVSPTSTDSVSSTTVSVASSTISVSSDDDNDDDDTDKKAEKKLEKEVEKEEKRERREEKSKKEAVLERVKITIEEVAPPTAKALEGTSTVSRSDGAFGNLASILSSLSGVLGRMSSFFR